MRFLSVAVLSALLILGVSAAAVAQQTQPQTADQPGQSVDKAPGAGSSSSEAPKAEPQAPQTSPSSSSSTSVEVKPQPDAAPASEGMASPRTDRDGTRIFGLSPTVAALLAAGILVVVIIALVAMSHGGSTMHVERIDRTDRRL